MRSAGAASLVVLLVLAGCADAPGGPVDVSDGPAADGDHGSVVGTVVDEEFFPIAGATVGVADLDVQTTTDLEGKYALPAVTAGTQEIQVIALGYQSLSKRVDVAPDARTTVDFVLEALPSDEPYVDVVPHSGLVRSITWRIGSSCETVVQPPIGTCLGYQPSSLILYHETEPDWGTMIGELTWEPNSAIFHQRAYMYVTFPNVSDFSGVPDFESPGHFETGGESPQTLRIDRETIRERGHPEESHWGETRFRALNNFDDVNVSGLAGVSLMLDQPMDMYWSFFYRQTAPDVYSVLPDE